MSANRAFEILYREYYVRVFGLCRRLLNSAALAEDATQETFMRAYRTFSRFDPAQPFWQWIAAIASNHCVDLLRRQTRSRDLFGEADEELEAVAADTQTLAQLLVEEDASVLNDAVDGLPHKYRVPLVLAYFHDASYDEIAATLNVTRSHVGVLLLRAKVQLRDRLQSGEGQ